MLGQWSLQPDRDVALIQMGGSQETLPVLRRGAVDGGMRSSPLHLQAGKLGYPLLADLSAIGVAYQGAGVVTTRNYRRESPDTVRRYLRAYVEGLHRFKTDKSVAVKVIGKYSRIADPEALEETYQHYAVKVMPKVPYPTTRGIQMVLDEIGARTAKAKSLSPENFIDVSYLRGRSRAGSSRSYTTIARGHVKKKRDPSRRRREK